MTFLEGVGCEDLDRDGSRAAQECSGMAREFWIADGEAVMIGKDGRSVAGLVVRSWPMTIVRG